MDNYLLQTEVTNEIRREVALKTEKRALESEIQEQKKKIKKHLAGFLSSLSLLILFHALVNFFWQHPVSVFFYSVFGILNLIQALWLLDGWRKRRQKLESWNKTVEEIRGFDENK